MSNLKDFENWGFDFDDDDDDDEVVGEDTIGGKYFNKNPLPVTKSVYTGSGNPLSNVGFSAVPEKEYYKGDNNMRTRQRVNSRPVGNSQNKSGWSGAKQIGKDFSGDNFKSATIGSVGKVARWVWSIMVRGTLYGALLGASIADIFGGAVALALIFTNPSEFAGISVSSGIVATGMSMFTSGIQIFFLVTWTERGTRKLSMGEKIYMAIISLVDTLFDMTVPFWWTYGETPLNMSLDGKPFMFYLAVVLFAMICLVSERFMLKVANYKG